MTTQGRRSVVVVSALAITAATSSGAYAQEAKPKPTVSDDDKTQVVRFDDKRDVRTASFTIGVDPAPSAGAAPPALTGAVRGDLRSAQNRRLPSENVKVIKTKYNGLDAFDVTIQVTASNAIKPGRYTGTVVFGGPGYSQVVPVTVSATLRSGRFWSASLALLGFLSGVILKALTDIYKAPNEKVRSRSSFRKYFWRSGFIGTAALGLVGAIATWGFTYLGNDVWGAGDFDDLKLWGTTLAGVVTGTTLSDFFTPFKPSGT